MSSNRAFRKPESYEAEELSRVMVRPFLESRGFHVNDDVRKVSGTAQSQTVIAVTASGEEMKIRVRLCWRKERIDNFKTSAAQLRAHLVEGDWNKTLKHFTQAYASDGITHLLIFQRVGDSVPYAALVPLKELGRILRKQAQVSEKLIRSGRMGRISKNHTKNGGSPTIWLMDCRTPDAHLVADVLWEWPGVQNLALLPVIGAGGEGVIDDTVDDISSPDYSLLGSDSPARTVYKKSGVKRDHKVRMEVIERSKGRCERPSCSVVAAYRGFLDVHHVLGADVSDRVWNCVALCPNCHRDAHFSPDHEEINGELLRLAELSKTDH
ncbi:HNH endonuclease [Achromobacter insuavis]|uniref:HNH endonuclease n=1 Tax=Achromobacter insuavis TaxID=1287735 RepID=UPI001F13CA11|nr:HNH endonuclease [Achromobacter insuavis]